MNVQGAITGDPRKLPKIEGTPAFSSEKKIAQGTFAVVFVATMADKGHEGRVVAVKRQQ